MREHVKIKESLRIVVKDSKTGKIIRDEMYYPCNSVWDKFLCMLRLKKCCSTMTTKGREWVARLLGNEGTQAPIDRIGAYDGSTWTWKTITKSITTTDTTNDTLVVSNENDHWGSGSYTKIGCKNSSLTDADRHNEITVNVKISSGQEWWAEIRFDID